MTKPPPFPARCITRSPGSLAVGPRTSHRGSEAQRADWCSARFSTRLSGSGGLRVSWAGRTQVGFWYRRFLGLLLRCLGGCWDEVEGGRRKEKGGLAIIDSDPPQNFESCEMGIHPHRLLRSLSQVGNLGFKPSKLFVNV